MKCFEPISHCYFLRPSITLASFLLLRDPHKEQTNPANLAGAAG
jgi:hypothetical protein